jgi:hypothetical protein
MSAEVPVSITNAGTCASSTKPKIYGSKVVRLTTEAVSRKVYTINGAFIGEDRKQTANRLLKSGLYISVDKLGKCTRFIGLR